MNFINKLRHNLPILPPYNNYILLTVVGILVLSIVLSVTLTLSSRDVRSRASAGDLISCADTNEVDEVVRNIEEGSDSTQTKKEKLMRRAEELKATLASKKEEIRSMKDSMRANKDQLKQKLIERKTQLKALMKSDPEAALKLIKEEEMKNIVGANAVNCVEKATTVKGTVSVMSGSSSERMMENLMEITTLRTKTGGNYTIQGDKEKLREVSPTSQVTVSGYQVDKDMLVDTENPESIKIEEANPNVLQAADSAQAPTWKALFLIYRRTNTRGINVTVPQYQVDATRQVISNFTKTVTSWSNGYAKISATIVEPSNAITRISQISGSYYWVDAADVKSDLATYAPKGRYDSIFVIWRNDSGYGSIINGCNCGWSIGPGESSPNAFQAGYTQIDTPDNGGSWGGVYPEEMFVHEWLHQVERFYKTRTNIHQGEINGYSPSNGSWSRWLSDFMQGKVSGSITPSMWKSKTPTGGTGTTVSNPTPTPTKRPAMTTTPYVGQGSGADLVVTSLHLTDSAGNVKTSFKVGERIYVKVTLKNQGTTVGMSSVDATYSQIYANKPLTVGLNALSDKNISMQNGEFGVDYYRTYNSYPNSSTLIFFPQSKSWIMSSVGTYTARAFIDYNNTVKETNETNNQRTTTYTIVP